MPTLLAGVALGAMIVYLGTSIFRAGTSLAIPRTRARAMSLSSDVCMSGCPGGRPLTVDITGRPYSVSGVPGLINFPYLPSGMTSVTGVYPPATGPY